MFIFTFIELVELQANTAHPELYIRSASVETLLLTGEQVTVTTAVNNSFTVTLTNTGSVATNLTDRLVCKFKCDNGNGTPDMHITVDGDTSAGVIIPVPSSTFVLKTGDTMTGDLTSTGFTGSLFGTASNSVSSSYTPYSDNSISSSYSISASWAPGGGSSLSASWASSSLSSSYSISASWVLGRGSSISSSWSSASLSCIGFI